MRIAALLSAISPFLHNAGKQTTCKWIQSHTAKTGWLYWQWTKMSSVGVSILHKHIYHAPTHITRVVYIIYFFTLLHTPRSYVYVQMVCLHIIIIFIHYTSLVTSQLPKQQCIHCLCSACNRKEKNIIIRILVCKDMTCMKGIQWVMVMYDHTSDHAILALVKVNSMA